MEDCLYCGDDSYKNMFSLKTCANGGYCCLECVEKDIKRHKDFIKIFKNEASIINNEIIWRSENTVDTLTEEEANDLEDKLSESLQRQTVLLQTLPIIESLLETKKLRWRESK